MDCPNYSLPFDLPFSCEPMVTFLGYMIPVTLLCLGLIVWTVVLIARERRFVAEERVVEAETVEAFEWWNQPEPVKPRELAAVARASAHVGMVAVDTGTVEIGIIPAPITLEQPFTPAPVALDMDQPADPIAPVEEPTDG